jgi:hypothetical protein
VGGGQHQHEVQDRGAAVEMPGSAALFNGIRR